MKRSLWEARVSQALRAKTAYCFKPPDGAMYGGQPRVDFMFCTPQGKFGVCEVKAIPEGARKFDINNERFMTPGQRAALTSVVHTEYGVAVLAVGRGNRELFLFDWDDIRTDADYIYLDHERHRQWIIYQAQHWPTTAFDMWLGE